MHDETPLKALIDYLTEVAWGKRTIAERLVLALIVEGHVLVEDVPGVGKTTLVRRLAEAVGLGHRRLQCTPDLLPSDVTGFTYFDVKAQRFEFREGPAFTNLLMADEINRTSPKTQASLLEAMEERQITVDGQVRKLPEPFFVVATQNPVEHQGTFPLPEAQLDRFLMRLQIGYPSPELESQALRSALTGPRVAQVSLDHESLRHAAEAATAVTVGAPIADYIVRVGAQSRRHGDLDLGLSPRALQSWTRAAKALAMIRGRTMLLPDDLQELAIDCLAHRLVLRPESQYRGVRDGAVVEEFLRRVPLPQSA